MPLVYGQAVNRWKKIFTDQVLQALEIAGFVKCIARGKCLDSLPKDEYVASLWVSIKKQYNDLEEAKTMTEKLEAIADLRNVAGLLFEALANQFQE